MNRVQKLICFFFGHKFYSPTEVDNGLSKFGTYKCQRCGLEEDWQFDYRV